MRDNKEIYRVKAVGLGVSEEWGYVFWGPQNRGCNILESILGHFWFLKGYVGLRWAMQVVPTQCLF